jgi:hypothetical protein
MSPTLIGAMVEKFKRARLKLLESRLRLGLFYDIYSKTRSMLFVNRHGADLG